MPRKKSPANVVSLEDSFMQDAMAGMFMDNSDVISDVTSVMSSVCNNSIELSKLVIENKVRNSEKLEDSDIYKIHRDSLLNIMKSMDKAFKT